jgi:uncharacterized membrane protein
MREGDATLALILSYVIPFVEACGALVVILGVARAIVAYVHSYFSHGRVPVAPLRIQLGQSVIVGIEFQVAADVLRTAANPAWDDILFLAVLIGIRTVLNFLLEWELAHLNGVDHTPEYAPMRSISARRREARQRRMEDTEREEG